MAGDYPQVVLTATGGGFRESISGTGGGKTEMWVITTKMGIDFYFHASYTYMKVLS
jgi:hypothetical protein